MTDLLIFDEKDELLAVASNEADSALKFWNADFEEALNNGSTFEFSAEPLHENSQHIMELNQVAFLDKDGHFRLFRIFEVESVSDRNGAYIRAICEDSALELKRNILTDIRPQNVTLRFALERALSGQTRWQVGEVADLGLNSTNFFYKDTITAIARCLEVWRAELRIRVEIDGNRIIGRYIDAISRGRDTGLVLNHNVENMLFRVETDHIRTLLYGRGASIPIYDDETGEATGGYSRRVMFGDAVGTVNQHGFDKPRGQLFVEDRVARELYGLIDANGNRQHLQGVFESGFQDEPEYLMVETWEQLQVINKPHYYAKVSMVDLSNLLGEEFNHEQLRLGDVIRLVDQDSFTRPVMIETRVVSYRYDITDPFIAQVELGNHRDLYSNDQRIRDIEDNLNNGSWNRPPLINEDNIIAPVVPITGFEARGLHSSVMLAWDNQRLGITYELHASEVQGFAPTQANLIFRGVGNGFHHTSDHMQANQQWYYRVRATNSRGNISDWSNEVMAQTVRIIAPDIFFGEDIARELYELSQIHDIIGPDTVDFKHIKSAAIRTAHIQNLAVERAHLQDAIIGSAQIQNLAVNDAHIGNVSADKISVGTLQGINISGVNINGSIFTTTGNGATTVIRNARIETNYNFTDNFGAQQGRSILEPNALTFIPTRTDGISVTNVRILMRPEGLYRQQGNNFTHYINMRQSDAIRFYGHCLFIHGANMNNRPLWNAQSIRVFTAGTNGGFWFPSATQGGTQNWRLIEADNGLMARAGNVHFTSRGRKRVSIIDNASRLLIWRNQSNQSQTQQDAVAYDNNAVLVHGAGNWTNYRIGPMPTGSLRVTTNVSNTAFRPVIASAFNVGSSRNIKENIRDIASDSALDLINSLDVKTYTYKLPNTTIVGGDNEEVEYTPPEGYTPERHLGIILEESPSEIISEDGEGINTTKVLFYNVSAVQELTHTVNELTREIEILKKKVGDYECHKCTNCTNLPLTLVHRAGQILSQIQRFLPRTVKRRRK